MLPDLTMRLLSPDFSLYQLVRSDTAERQPEILQQQLDPPAVVIDNLTYLALTVLQPLHEQFDYPLQINSGYRSEALTRAVGGSLNSPHVLGQAADVMIAPGFLTDERCAALRETIQTGVQTVTGRALRPDVTANFYLYAYLCLNLDRFDVDEVIHEYGTGPGQPAWVHLSASTTGNKRSILAQGQHLSTEQRGALDLRTALSLGT